jgi:hypothetical protein
MAGDGDNESTRPYNVVGAFPTERDATMAVERLTTDGIPRSAVAVHDPRRGSSRDERAELRAEMQEELAEGWIGPAGLTMTGSQAKGAFFGTVFAAGVGGAVGLAAGFAWAYAVDSTLSRPARILLTLFLGIIGGATVGFLAGGIHGQQVDARTGADMVAERDWLIAVHANETEIAERAAAVLRAIGAERVDLVDGSGTPLPPQAQNPRPADPPGWWWRRAGRG